MRGGISFQMGLGMLRVTQTGGDARLSKASHEVLCLRLGCQGHSWSYVARNALCVDEKSDSRNKTHEA